MNKQAMRDSIKNMKADVIDQRYIDPKISACMIVLDEGMMIHNVLESVAPFVDEIIVCDTGSEDNTVEEIEKAQKSIVFGDKIKLFTDYKWNDDFSEARWHSINKATHDWIFIVDGHEVIEGNPDFLREEIKNSAKHKVFPHGYRMPFYDIRNNKVFSKSYTNTRLLLRDKLELKEPIHNQILVKTHQYIESGKVLHVGYGENNPKVIERRNKRNKQTRELLEKRISELRSNKKNWDDEDKKSYGYMAHQLALLLDGFFHEYKRAEHYYKTAIRYKKYFSPDVANNTYSGYVRLLAKQDRNDEMIKTAFDALAEYKYNVDIHYILGMRSFELQQWQNSIIALSNYFHSLCEQQRNETICYHEKDVNIAAYTLLIQHMANGIVPNANVFENVKKYAGAYSFETRVLVNYMFGTVEHEKEKANEAGRANENPE
jgi:glycosyltransferase involved in cell wall biosynthesis